MSGYVYFCKYEKSVFVKMDIPVEILYMNFCIIVISLALEVTKSVNMIWVKRI